MIYGMELLYKSLAGTTVLFDSVLSNNTTGKLTYNQPQDSLTFEYHHVDEYHAASAQYIQRNVYLHTH